MQTMNHAAWCSGSALVGVVVGAALALCAATFWPATRIGPSLVNTTQLRFGVDEHGVAALCDQDGIAYTLGRDQGMQRAVYRSEFRDGVLTPLRCKLETSNEAMSSF